MRAMILAAGRGERLRPLTDRIPKPMVEVGGRPLVEHTVRRLVAAGFVDLVVNHAWLGHLIEAHLGDGRRLGARIVYSAEPPGALEVAGGIRNALPLLGRGPFVAINADVWCDHPLAPLREVDVDLAHLVLVDNPEHVPRGDFALAADGRVDNDGPSRLTFAGIGVYRAALFDGHPTGRLGLAPVLRAAAACGRVRGEHHRGDWVDVGTVERLAALDARLGARGG
ncbi:MAG: nucleotidyltransferase family protein [Ectothiorhodospiraceae bacterium]|nr:nucleotidyltransferase family protein [Chromatiales bacterium]MCP5157580.1 nucleotidyltransferase family protein [Ectothiorhodospiraceae bacterium]